MDTRRGFQIGTIRGIPIRIHYTFLLVLPFLAYAFGRNFVLAARSAGVPPAALSGPPWLWGLGIALALFLSVLVHELAHSLYALSRGGRVRSITLLMIGGVSELTQAPRLAGQEAVMAAVGPGTSLALGAVFYGLFRGALTLGQLDVGFGLFYLAELNLFLGLFNFLPAFPMDGGRVLRGLLARKRGPVRATQIAANVGKAFAVVFAIYGLFSGNILLILVAFFVFVGAEGEEREVLARAALGELRLREILSPPAPPVSAGDSLYEVGERMIREGRLAYPVLEDGRILGLVSLESLERTPLEQRAATAARDALEAAPVLRPDDRVADALRAMAERRTGRALVVEDGQLAGIVSQDQIMRSLRLRALEESQHRGPRGWRGRRAAV